MSAFIEENISDQYASFSTVCGPSTPPALSISSRFSSSEKGTLQKSSRKSTWQQRWDQSAKSQSGLNHGSIATLAVLTDEYKVLREIGRGASGVVYEAIHIKVRIVSLNLHAILFVSRKIA